MESLMAGGESLEYAGSQAVHEHLLQEWRGLRESPLTEKAKPRKSLRGPWPS